MNGATTTQVAHRRLTAVPLFGCAFAIAIVLAFARERPPAPYAIAALAAIGVAYLPFVRAWRERHHAVQIAGLLVFALLTAPIGWMFGPSSSFGAVLAIVFILVGLQASRLGGWLFYGVAASCQAAVTALVLTGVLADESILGLIVPGHPMWHHWIAHGALQLVYAIAFVAGRAFQARYRRLSSDLDAAIQVAARRASLLDEARAEYLRTLALGRQGIFTGQSIGAFRLGEVLGRGGAGEVYDARAGDGTNVAVKLMRSDRLRDPAAIQSFIDEANAAMRIESPHVVQAQKIGGLDAEIPFLAMEKLDGADLRATIVARGAFSRDGLRELATDACAALTAVHAAGLAHGDVSPQNLIKTATGWKLIDFGSRAGAGTPRFTAPEMIASPASKPTPAADLYSLAACLYAAATGDDPYAETPPRHLAHAVATRMPIDPRLQGEVSDDVARVLQIGLASAPADRFADAASFGAAFLAAIDRKLEAPVRERAAALPAWCVAPPAVEPETTDLIARASRTSAPAIRVASANTDDASVGATHHSDPPSDASLPSSDTHFDATRDAAWQGAFLDKARRQRIGVLALCLGGGVLLGLILREREALWAAWIGIGGIALTMALHRSAETWPWVIVGALSVGPAFALGLHSGFAGVVALGLFAGRLFRAPWKSGGSKLTTDWLILIAIVIGHTIAFVLVATRVIADGGNTPVSYPGLPAAIGWCIHGLLMTTYAMAFGTAALIDRTFDQLVRRNELASRDAAQKQALLSTAREELDRALAGETGGLFTGSTIGGYTVEKLVGRGGMGEVYEARRDAQTVALKVIRADRIAPENLRRFAREASTLRQVESPYVSRVLEVGSDERVPYLAMELVQGTTLAELLREHERLDDASVRAMVRDISRGLEDVHCAGVLHRDVKPSNLVRTSSGQWKLVDFGIAKFLDGPSETTGNLVVGTPPFMAPEQLAGRAVDERADVFSLCAVVYRALVGRSAWTTETALAAVREQPADPAPSVGADLALALRIGLATRPTDRFATSVELGAAFDAAFQGRLDDGFRRRAHAILSREPWT